jgi:membrane dipeptidase
MMQMIGLSKAPVIASHSGVRKLANSIRNMDDEMLMAMKNNGGVIQMVALSGFVKTDPAERGPALTALRTEFGITQAGGATTTVAAAAGRGRGRGGAGTAAPRPCPIEAQAGRGSPAPDGANANLATLAPARRREYERRLAEIDKRWPAAGRATVRDFVDHIDYAVKLIGIDHVGISSDFDGGGGIEGWNSAAETFNVTLELVRRGYSEEQIGKIWSGNLLRVWSEVERVARQLQSSK